MSQIITGSEDGAAVIWGMSIHKRHRQLNPLDVKIQQHFLRGLEGEDFKETLHYSSHITRYLLTPSDCRSGERVAILDPYKAVRVTKRSKDKSPWVSCMALDSSENWLVSRDAYCVIL